MKHVCSEGGNWATSDRSREEQVPANHAIQRGTAPVKPGAPHNCCKRQPVSKLDAFVHPPSC
eukprot:12896582-Prorocentrum_lima.AAC.1